jgi:PAS domain S-box-containing protein
MAFQTYTSRLITDLQQDLETLVQNDPTSILLLNQDGIILVSNETSSRLLGLNSKDLAGQSIFALCSDELSTLQEKFSQTQKTSIAVPFELSKSGRKLSVHLYPLPEISQDNRLIILCLQDVTNRHKIMEQLHELSTQIELRIQERTRELEVINQNLQEEKQRAETLALFSQMLVASAHDYPKLLSQIADTIASTVKNLCIVITFSKDISSYEVAAISHPDVEITNSLQHILYNKSRPTQKGPILETLLNGNNYVTNNIADFPIQTVFPEEFKELIQGIGTGGAIAVPLRIGNTLLGSIVIIRGKNDPLQINKDVDFIESIIYSTALSIENARLFNQTEVNRLQLRGLSQRLVEVQETQFRHLAAELHDQVGQDLSTININLTLMRSSLLNTCPDVISRLDDTNRLVTEAIQHMRDIMAEFRPPVLDEYGLTAALYWYAEKYTQHTQIGVHVDDHLLKDVRLPPNIEMGLFRIAQEALNNTAKHAQASRVDIFIYPKDQAIFMEIIDNGIGFDPTQKKESPHWGIPIMQERAQAIGASLDVQSKPGLGTKLIIRIEREA